MEHETKEQGLFIAFEGLDGAGTTTQTRILLDWLEGQERTCIQTCEPTDLPIGKVIRQVLRGELKGEDGAEFSPAGVALLFAADRMDHLKGRVGPALNRGDVVITDRYVYSSMAYQGTLLPLDWVCEINSRARTPDLTLFLRVGVETSLARLGTREGRDIYEKEEMLTQVASGYDLLIERDLIPNVVVIDGELPLDEVTRQVQQAVAAHLRS